MVARVARLTDAQYVEASAMLAAGQMLSVVARHFNICAPTLTTQLCHRGMVSRRVHPDVLSLRQREIWDLHQGGMHPRQIADQLGTTDQSVASHLNKSRAKFARRKNG